jgi:hypothetical protein
MNCLSYYDINDPRSQDFRPYGLNTKSPFVAAKSYADLDMTTNYVSPITYASFSEPFFEVQLKHPTTTSTNEVLDTLLYHKQNKWIDLRTRVVFVDINFYNNNIDQACIMRLTAEITQGGELLYILYVNIM